MKQDCEIVKDLLPNYIENLVSDETKKYVQNHISKCMNCRKILNEINENNTLENEQNEEAEKAQIELIKKYKRKMIAIKISIIAFIIIIVLGIIIPLAIYIPKYMIIKKAYNKIQELSNMNNYKFTITQINTNYNIQSNSIYTENYYYKDGKFKNEYYLDTEKSKSYYGDIYSDTILYLFEDTKTKEHQPNTYENIFDIFSDIQYDVHSFFNVIGLNIREDIYNGKVCYVLRFGDSSSNYREIWIEKDTMLQTRELQVIFNKPYFERTFSIEPNIVTEQDITVYNLDNYSDIIKN